MKIGRLIVKVHFYRKNMKIRGTKLWEIIPAQAINAKGCIVSLYFTHIFITWLDPEWKSMLYRYHDYLVKETDIQEGRKTLPTVHVERITSVAPATDLYGREQNWKICLSCGTKL